MITRVTKKYVYHDNLSCTKLYVNIKTNKTFTYTHTFINKIDTYVNSTVNFDIECTATAIKELCQARDMGDTQLFNRQELTITIDTLCKQ